MSDDIQRPPDALAIVQQLHEIRAQLAILQRRPPRPATITRTFSPVPDQFCIVDAPLGGISCVLPQPMAPNRGQSVWLSFRNANPVRIECTGGLVNGVRSVISNARGMLELMSDGETGWLTMQLAGATGIAGAPGTPGAFGPTGPMGFQGDQGERGDDGFPGQPGAAGAAGATGATGTTGPAGAVGPTGPVLFAVEITNGETESVVAFAGAAGTAGATGATGTTGATGATGATGSSAPPFFLPEVVNDDPPFVDPSRPIALFGQNIDYANKDMFIRPCTAPSTAALTLQSGNTTADVTIQASSLGASGGNVVIQGNTTVGVCKIQSMSGFSATVTNFIVTASSTTISGSCTGAGGSLPIKTDFGIQCVNGSNGGSPPAGSLAMFAQNTAGGGGALGCPASLDSSGRAFNHAHSTVSRITSVITVTAATTALEYSGGAFTIPAASVAAGTTYRFTGHLVFVRGATATAMTLTTAVLVAGAPQATTGALTTTTVAGTGEAAFEGFLTIVTTGAAGTAIASLRGYETGVRGTAPACTYLGNNNTATFVFNSTISNTIDMTSAMNVGVAGCTITATAGVIERLAA